jgi:hypothetical protein
MHGFLVRVTKEKPKLETHLIEFDEDICVQFYAGTLRLHEGSGQIFSFEIVSLRFRRRQGLRHDKFDAGSKKEQNWDGNDDP